MSTVVILNGVSSAGKTSTATALQKIAKHPLERIALDDFLSRMPAESFGTEKGLTFITRESDRKISTEVVAGPLVTEALDAMRRAIKTLADAGTNIVVDHVLFEQTEYAAYRDALAGHTIGWVALKPPLDVAERREKERGDRNLGLARWQFERVHRGIAYDLECDSSRGSPEYHARAIRDAFDL